MSGGPIIESLHYCKCLTGVANFTFSCPQLLEFWLTNIFIVNYYQVTQLGQSTHFCTYTHVEKSYMCINKHFSWWSTKKTKFVCIGSMRMRIPAPVVKDALTNFRQWRTVEPRHWAQWPQAGLEPRTFLYNFYSLVLALRTRCAIKTKQKTHTIKNFNKLLKAFPQWYFAFLQIKKEEAVWLQIPWLYNTDKSPQVSVRQVKIHSCFCACDFCCLHYNCFTA